MRLFNSRGPRSQSKSMSCLLLYLVWLVSEYMFICCCFILLRNFFNQKYSAISRDPFYGFKLFQINILVRICVKIARLIAE